MDTYFLMIIHIYFTLWNYSIYYNFQSVKLPQKSVFWTIGNKYLQQKICQTPFVFPVILEILSKFETSIV